jgi:hypothetical protein
VEVELHAFLTSALNGDEWSASCPSPFIPVERAPGTQWALTSFVTYTFPSNEINEGELDSAYGTYEEHYFNWKI